MHVILGDMHYTVECPTIQEIREAPRHGYIVSKPAVYQDAKAAAKPNVFVFVFRW
jgi:hypothetical protein